MRVSAPGWLVVLFARILRNAIDSIGSDDKKEVSIIQIDQSVAEIWMRVGRLPS